jgi:hypothetical protein
MGQEILACETVGITVTLPKPMTSSAKAAGRFGKQDFVYVVADDVYRCPAVNDKPSGCINLNHSPRLVTKIEIKLPVMPADSDMDQAFGRVEMRLRLDHVQRRLQRFRTRRALRFHSCSQDDYLAMVNGYAEHFGLARARGARMGPRAGLAFRADGLAIYPGSRRTIARRWSRLTDSA